MLDNSFQTVLNNVTWTQYSGIETFPLLGHILVWGYWNILPPEVLKYWVQNLERFWTISSLSTKLLYLFRNILIKKQRIFCPKMFQYPNAVYYERALLQSLSKNRWYFFFLIFWHAKNPPSFGMQCYWHYLFTYLFLSALRFSKLICLTKNAVLIRLEIKTICLTKKLFWIVIKKAIFYN